MKKLLLYLILLFLVKSAQSQIINGKVLDLENKLPVPVAVVYFDGTSVAVYTDEEGIFSIDSKSHGGMPLTISALGYYSRVLSEFSPNGSNTVYLEPKIFEFRDVTINARANPNIRKQNLAIFRREFLGRTKNSRECTIMNEDDIRFITSGNKDTLRAFSLKPIFIVNRALGYRLTYYLNKFEYVESSYTNQLIGNSIFDEDTSSIDPADLKSRRDNAYYGSKMHFIRSLWKTEENISTYSIKYGRNEIKPINIIRKQLSIVPGEDKRMIYYPEGVPVILTIRWIPGKAESGMELVRNNISIEKNGFYKGPGIIWHGEMARQGIADLLPYDYKPSAEFDSRYYSNFIEVDSVPAGMMSNIPELTEKVYLHFDRDIYSPGDDIWFKAYLVDGLSHEITDSSGNLYVELISPEARVIEKKILKIQKGHGNGDFSLPGNLPYGNYILRAYTRFMRNFGDQVFYYKNVRIFAGSEIQNPRNTATDSSDLTTGLTGFRIFPEGGSLVENVLSTVAFKAVDSDGRGCEVKGEIISSSGISVTTFQSSHLGMGKFSFRPEEGIGYTAIIACPDGSTFKENLPAIFPTGFVMSIQKNNQIETLVTFRTNSKTFSVYKDRDVMVTISSHGKIIRVISTKITSLNTSFVLPEEELPNGIVMLTLSGKDGKPLCERLIYIDKKPGMVVDIESDKPVYQKRDSVSISFSVSDDRETGHEAYLSLLVSNDIFSIHASSSITSWFLLESDIRGPVEEPSSYFDNTNPSRFNNLDLLLLTQGWRDFEWKYKKDRFLPEKGFIISGRLRKALLDIPVSNQEISLIAFQENSNSVISTRTDSSGRFRFEIENLSGNSRMVFSAINKRGNPAGELLLDSLQNFAPVNRTNMVRPLILQFEDESKETPGRKENDEIVNNLKMRYALSDTIMIGEVQITAAKKSSPQELRITGIRDKYGTPDDEVVVTPALRNAFGIKELLTGKVAGLMFVKPSSPSDSGIRIRGVSSMTFSQEPLFLLDGITSSYYTVSMIPASFIDRVDVIKSERASAYGIQGANGIISIITKSSGDLSETISPKSISMAFEGFSEPRIFYSPTHNYKLETDYRPDLRSTLLWMPDIKINTNENYRVKFFNGDIATTYRIVIEGITSDGIPVTGRLEYKIEDK